MVAKYVPRRRNQEKIMKICAIRPSQGSALAQKTIINHENLRHQAVAGFNPGAENRSKSEESALSGGSQVCALAQKTRVSQKNLRHLVVAGRNPGAEDRNKPEKSAPPGRYWPQPWRRKQEKIAKMRLPGAREASFDENLNIFKNSSDSLRSSLSFS